MDLIGYITAGILIITVAFIAFAVFKSVRNRRAVEGTVIHKDFRPARTTTRTHTHNQYQNNNNMRNPHMRNRRNVPRVTVETRTIPEVWSVTVQPSDGSSKVTRKVSADQWNAINTGDSWSD